MTYSETHRAAIDSVHGWGTILSIWAHPDDETYLAGGVMAAARDNGQRVVCISATAGEHGTDDPATWPPGRLQATRRWEAAAAMSVLGVHEHRVWDYRDGGLDAEDAMAVRRVGAVVDAVRPDTILTFGADGMTFHPDHIAVHRWVTAAWKHRGRRERLLYATSSVEFLDRHRVKFEEWGIYMSDARPTGVPAAELALHLHLRGAALDRKLTALRAMATQTAGAVAGMGLDEYCTQIADEFFVDATRVLHAEPQPDDLVAGERVAAVVT
jgi:LmbE family N-acetylglucosaminyl deacetylase